MKVIVRETNHSLIEFYDEVARLMGYGDTSNLKYDCRQINVAENIQEGFYEYYTKCIKETHPYLSENDITTEITMLLAISGPKVDKSLKANEAEVFEQFICQ